MLTEIYLQKARDYKFRVDQINEERADVRAAMSAIRSTSDYTERVQTSPKGDGLETQVIRGMEKLEKLDLQLATELQRLITLRNNIRRNIDKMKDGRSRRFLIDYYIKCKSYEEIWEEYNIEPDYHMKRRAIREYEAAEKI